MPTEKLREFLKVQGAKFPDSVCSELLEAESGVEACARLFATSMVESGFSALTHEAFRDDFTLTAAERREQDEAAKLRRNASASGDDRGKR